MIKIKRRRDVYRNKKKKEKKNVRLMRDNL